jgi:SMI1 / KNR4 family (SUKH-1)
MEEHYEALFQRIREKCRRQGWYGPDMENPFKKLQWLQEADVPNTYMAYSWYDRAGNQYKIEKDTDLSHFPIQPTFEHPPATEAQLVATEEALGFSLPRLLRELYANIANGGFGPGYGINGAFGGFGDMMNNIADGYLSMKSSSRLVDIAIYEHRQGTTTRLAIPFYVHPDRFLTLCHWGCAIFSYLDCNTDRVFRGAAERETYGFTLEATSFYEWIDLWSKDALKF